MLTKSQLNQIAQDFKIDTFSVLREYIQLVFLNYFYQDKQSEHVFFKGGTCLRLLYHSPRFSEDLDFSTMLSDKPLKQVVQKAANKTQKEMSQIELSFVWRGEQSVRYRLTYQGEESKYPLGIRLDFDFDQPIAKPEAMAVDTKIPINFLPLVLALKKEEILTEKIRAFSERKKGRDIFDFWYLLNQRTPINKQILSKKMAQVDLKFSQAKFLEEIKEYPSKKLNRDLARFLPRHYRKLIPTLQDKIAKNWPDF